MCYNKYDLIKWQKVTTSMKSLQGVVTFARIQELICTSNCNGNCRNVVAMVIA